MAKEDFKEVLDGGLEEACAEKEVKENVVEAQEEKMINLSIDSVNQYIAKIDLIMIGDAKAFPLKQHFLNAIALDNPDIKM